MKNVNPPPLSVYRKWHFVYLFLLSMPLPLNKKFEKVTRKSWKTPNYLYMESDNLFHIFFIICAPQIKNFKSC